jgi:hypothetical protein
MQWTEECPETHVTDWVGVGSKRDWSGWRVIGQGAQRSGGGGALKGEEDYGEEGRENYSEMREDRHGVKMEGGDVGARNPMFVIDK